MTLKSFRGYIHEKCALKKIVVAKACHFLDGLGWLGRSLISGYSDVRPNLVYSCFFIGEVGEVVSIVQVQCRDVLRRPVAT